MARVQLDATAFVRSGTAVSLQSGIQLNVYHRGTLTLATGYTTEAGATTVTYPLSSNVEGQFTAWYPPGKYDLDSPSDTIAAPMAWDAVSAEYTDEFHVDSYGAVGDGATDDSAAINAAVTAAAGMGVVKFGPKTYKLTTDSIRIPPAAGGLTFQGSGRGVTTILSGGASAGSVAHAFQFVRSADHQVFKNITIQDLSINMNSRTDTRVYGVGTRNLTTAETNLKPNYEDIAIRRIRVYGLTARSASSMGGVDIANHQAASGATQNWTKRVTIQDVVVDGGNLGVSVTASSASPNVYHDEILVERVHHDPGSIMTSSWASAGVQIGSYAAGGRGTIRDCWVYGHSDVGYEINSFRQGLVQGCQAVECNGNAFYHTNFGYPALEGSGAPGSGNNTLSNQVITFRDCHVAIRTAAIVAGGGHGFRTAPNNSIGAGQLVYDNCSYIRKGTEADFGLQGEALLIGSTPGTDPTIRAVQINNCRFEAQDVSIPAGGATATTHSMAQISAPVNNIRIRNSWIRFDATKDAAAATHTLHGFDVRSSAAQFDVDGLEFDLVLTRLTVIGVRLGGTGTTTQSGTLDGVRLVAATDTSSTWTMIDIGAGTMSSAGIAIRGGHWTLLPAAGIDVNIDAAQLPVVNVDDSNIINAANSVASAATITLPAGGPSTTYVAVTGTTNITGVTASWEGRVVTLKFAGILTFTDGGNLVLESNFVTSANDTITLLSDGTNWYELSRAAN